jgi:predicted AAA+ superfamily ATPase
MRFIERAAHARTVLRLLREHPVVVLLGARQVGKTTLAKHVASSFGASTFFDAESRADAALLTEPELALRQKRGLVVIDEVQLVPEVLRTVRVLADRPRCPARFLLLGSASPELAQKTTETLAGRVAFHEMAGFDLDEVTDADRLWFRGGFPRSYLARSNRASDEWRRDFVRTFLERDLPRLGIGVAPRTLERFWAMLAHYHGQLFNASELGRSFGVAHTTIRAYLDVLVGTFVVTELRPWAENVGKRVVKSPKIFIADPGLLHALLDISSPDSLERHPKLGASWEGFVQSQIIRRLRARPSECYFWSVHSGPELDLLVVSGNRRYGFEIKRTDAPRVTASMQAASDALSLNRLDLVHAGNRSYQLGKAVRAIAASDLLREIKPLRRD